MKEILLKIDMILKENESRQDLNLGCLLPDWAVMQLESLKDDVRKLDNGGSCSAPADNNEENLS
jgi:hypothetical protein